MESHLQRDSGLSHVIKSSLANRSRDVRPVTMQPASIKGDVCKLT
jgi:hypothetical protein